MSFTLCSQPVESGFNQYGTSETPLEGNSQGSCGPNGCASTVILDSGFVILRFQKNNVRSTVNTIWIMPLGKSV